jgi:hypothetical protein
MHTFLSIGSGISLGIESYPWSVQVKRLYRIMYQDKFMTGNMTKHTSGLT